MPRTELPPGSRRMSRTPVLSALSVLAVTAATLSAVIGGSLAPASALGAQTTYLVSKGAAASREPSLSPDGRHLAFTSDAALVAADTNSVGDIYLSSTAPGSPTPFVASPVLVSVSSAGAPANGKSYDAAVSADGHFVAFTSDATNLVTGDTNGQPDLFMRDTFVGTTTRVQAAAQPARSGCGISLTENGATSQPAISADGSVVAFTSGATNLVSGDTNCMRDVFRVNRDTGVVTRVTSTTTGPSYDPAISGDGTYVSYTTESGGDTHAFRSAGGSPEPIGRNSDGDHTGQTSLSADGVIAYVSSQTSYHGISLPSGAKVFVEWPGGHWEWVSDGLTAGTAVSRPAVSADGSAVAFVAGTQVRLAETESRFGASSAVTSDGIAAAVVGPAASSAPTLTSTGRTVALTTTTDLPGDGDTAADVAAVAIAGKDQLLHPALDTFTGIAKPRPLGYVDPARIPATVADGDDGPESAGRGIIGRGIIGRGIIGRGIIGRGIIGRGIIGRGIIGRGIIGRGIIGRGIIGDIPISNLRLSTPGGWTEFFKGTPFENVPFDGLTFGEVGAWVSATLADPGASAVHKQKAQAIYDLGLSDFDPESPLGRLTIGSILLLAEPLAEIDLPGSADNLTSWRDAVSRQGFAPSIVDASTLLIDLDARGVDIAQTGVGSAVASSVAPARTAFGFVALSDLNLDTPLGSVSVAELPAAVAQAVVDCPAFNGCQSGTLKQADDAGKLRAATLADLAPGLPERITLDEVVRAMIDPLFFPWENLQWDAVGAGRYAIPKDTPAEGPGFAEVSRYRAGFDTGSGGAAYVRDAVLEVHLPPGTAFHDASFTATGPREYVAPYTPEDTSVEDLGSIVRFHLGDVPSGTTITAKVLATDSVNYKQDDPVLGVLSSATGSDDARITLQGLAGYADLVDPPGSDSPTSAPRLTVPNRVYLGGITSADDEDYVLVPRAPFGKRLVMGMGTVGGDLDLGVFRATSPGEESTQDPAGFGPSPLLENLLTGGHHQPAPLDILDVPGYSLVDASTHTGTQEESVSVSGSAASGDLLVRVASADGRTSTLPYTLRYLYVDEPPEQHCPAYTPPHSSDLVLPPIVPPLLLPGTNTIFLVDTTRMVQQYGVLPNPDDILQLPIDAGQWVLNALGNLDGEFGVKSAVIPITGIDLLGGHPTQPVIDARAALDADPCSVRAANRMAKAVRDLLGTYLTPDIMASLKNVVIVGGDDQIPFHRVPGATFDVREEWNETALRLATARSGNCAAQPCDRQATPLSAAAAGDFIVTDDPYGDRLAAKVLDRDLYVPEVALGRLVESPQDIRAAVLTFLERGGVLQADTALSTGYGAWDEVPPAIAAAVADRVAGANNKTLTGEWSKANLKTALGFDSGAAAPKIVSVNAHMTETGLLPGIPGAGDGAYDKADVYDTAQLPADVRNRLAGRIMFTIGCHAGGALPDAWYGNATQDWAQVLGGSGGYIANTGYGIADDAATALSERLITQYSAWVGTELDGAPVTAGQALARAKQAYLDGLGLYLGHDEKVLMQATYYGLPMYTFGGATRPAPKPATATWSPGTSVGLTTRSATFTPDFQTVTAADGSQYLQVAGQAPQVSPGNPILAKLATTLETVSGQQPQGALITALRSSANGPTSVTVASATSGGDIPPDRFDDIGFPSSLAHVNGQQLTLLADRVDADSAGAGTQGATERFETIGVTAYYGSGSDRRAPFVDATSALQGGTRTFTVVARDAAGAGTTKRAVVMHQVAGNANWTLLELSRVSGDTWRGSIADPGVFRAFAQVVDANGNVGIDMERGHLSQGSLAFPAFDGGANASIEEGVTLTRELAISDGDSDRFTGTVDYGFGPQALEITRGPDGTFRAHLEIAGVPPGTYPVLIEVCDDSGLCTQRTFTLTVLPANSAPQASVTLDTLRPVTDHVLVATAIGTDPDGDDVTLRYQWWVNDTEISGATGTTFDLGVPGHGDEGDTVTVTVIPNDGQLDGGGSSASAVVRRNNPPTVSAGLDKTANEGSAYTSSGTYAEPDGDAVTGTVDYGDGTPVQALTLSAGTFPLSHTYVENGSYTVTVKIVDEVGATAFDTALVTVVNVAPTISPNLTPAPPTVIGGATVVNVAYTDPGTLDTHTVTVDWGDGTTSSAVADQEANTATASHTYLLAGTYVIGVTVTDDDGGTTTESPYDYGAVFDSTAGYVTGNGYFTSPPGAWPANPTASGQAEFGMNAKYTTGSTVPTGKTRFTYDIQPDDHGCMAASCLQLDSTTYASLVISGSKATLKGAGTLNGTTGYTFLLVVIDGSPDKVRVKITNRLNKVIYDSQPGAAETADPTSVLGGGSVLIKKAS
jgi:Tol biopolymer transport system component